MRGWLYGWNRHEGRTTAHICGKEQEESCLVERLWPITHRVLAVRFDNEILGNTWWAFKPNR